MKILGISLLVALSALAIYFIYLVHNYPTKKLRRINELRQRLDELIGIELFGAWTTDDEREVTAIMNELRELTDGH